MILYLDQSAGARWFEYLLGEILSEIPSSAVTSVADVGCGVGKKTAQLARTFPRAEVFGFDFSESAIEVASEHYSSVKNLSFKSEDITRNDYDRRLDLVSAFDVLEHIDKWEEMLELLIEVGSRYLVISVPIGRMRPYEVNIGHYRNFQRGQIEEFLEARGYRTMKTFYAGFPFYSPILRDLTNRFFKTYSETPQTTMSSLAKTGHHIWYFLFRYLSLKQRGDIFLGSFERKPNR
jgi:trans-aconitate methyltransferase